ncbi:MAG: protein kinase, partial [Anaerolineae bacterium]|nr:protein kinase [Anaerolineae bacterium]
RHDPERWAAIGQIIDTAMQKQPENRYPSAEAMREALAILRQPVNPTVPSSSSSKPTPGLSTVVDSYEIIAELGQGSISKVYLARDIRLERQVSLKFLTPSDGRAASQLHLSLAPASQRRARFDREIKLVGQLNHPHIATLYDVDLTHEPPYLVMELLAAGSLAERLTDPLPWRESLILLRPLAEALAYAHQVGIVHRDVKPANVMFTTPPSGSYPSLLAADISGGGLLKLVDFGLAHWDTGQKLTETGDVLGTPLYMSPEQAHSGAVDVRSDIFALGLLLMEAITGHNPLDKGSPNAIWAELISDQPLDLTPLHQLNLPPSVIRLIERSTAKEPAQRFPTGADFLAALISCLGDDSQTGLFLAKTVHQPLQPRSRPTLQNKLNLTFNPEEESLLQSMFTPFDRLLIEAEFGRGLSGSRVLQVRPIDEFAIKRYLPAVIKIGSRWQIEQEWRAYQAYVEHILPQIARLEGVPILGERYGILRYSLVGSGFFTISSLYEYYHQVEAETTQWLLRERLFNVLAQQWWQMVQTAPNFWLQREYDWLLPVNLTLRYSASVPSGQSLRLTPDQLPPVPLKLSQMVEINNFIIIKINADKGHLILDLPSTDSTSLPLGYRLCLTDIPNINQYHAGQLLKKVWAEVSTTRHDMLTALVREVLGDQVDLTETHMSLNWPLNLDRPTLLPSILPNPLRLYPALLGETRPVHRSLIHGDLNLENILVNVETGQLSLIDFATARRGHTLHDLLRLETEVVTKLLPFALVEAGLPAESIYLLYRMAPPHTASVKLPAPLIKPLILLTTIRQTAQTYLFNPDDWTEYYQGLYLYLLGAVRFKNLDDLPQAPLPRQLAFWGAATVAALLETI